MKKELLTSFLAYGLTSALSKFVAVLLLPVYTRYFSNAEYGIVDLIQTIVSVTLVFGILQLETSLQRYYYEVSDEYRKRMASTVLFFVTGASLILMVPLQIFSGTISTLLFDSPDYAWELSISAFIIPLVNVSTISFVVIRYMKKSLLFGGVTLLQITVTAGFTLLFIYFDAGIASVFYGQIIGLVALICAQFVILRRFYCIAFDVKCMKEMMKFALPQFPARMGSVAGSYMNRFVMLGALSVSAVGIYSVALKFASVVAMLHAAFTMAWFPFFYETLKNPDHRMIFRNWFKYVCLGVGAIVTLISLFAREVMTLFVAPEFHEAGIYVGALCFYWGLFIIKDYVDAGPRITKKMQYVSYTYFSTAFLNFLLLYFLTPETGLFGVVWAMILTNVFLTSVSGLVSEKLYRIGFSGTTFVVLILTVSGIVAATMYFDLSLVWKTSIAVLTLIVTAMMCPKVYFRRICNLLYCTRQGFEQ